MTIDDTQGLGFANRDYHVCEHCANLLVNEAREISLTYSLSRAEPYADELSATPRRRKTKKERQLRKSTQKRGTRTKARAKVTKGQARAVLLELLQADDRERERKRVSEIQRARRGDHRVRQAAKQAEDDRRRDR